MAKPMTKTQLVAALAEEMGTDKKSANSALEAITGLITREVSAGGAVTLPGVGKIYCRERPERMVRNPATGEQFKKEADKVVKMTIAKALKGQRERLISVFTDNDEGPPFGGPFSMEAQQNLQVATAETFHQSTLFCCSRRAFLRMYFSR